ncbi:hypothetical protein HPB50_012240 [Hyalomma asiaticum]|uniref:Uncharacterized protein n=1 Tax=Hyalomma asiaticum TaxID=266040 RepID=A0ACB7SLC5_HYAAI|nr:hypothetical protein HPB50_012240 [Hyalomma asiaticum]
MFSVIVFVVAVACCSVQRCTADDVRATPAVPSSTPNPGGATEELKSASNESLVEAPPPPTTQQLDPDYGESEDDAEDEEEQPANDTQVTASFSDPVIMPLGRSHISL